MSKRGRLRVTVEATQPTVAAAELSLSEPEVNDTGDAFEVRGLIACQPYRIEQRKALFLVGFRQMYIQEHCVNCAPSPETVYEAKAHDGKASKSVSEHLEQVSEEKSSIGAALKATAVLVSGKMSSNADANFSQTAKRQEDNKTQLEVARVSRVAHGWRIGELVGGDPIRGQMLDGSYMMDRPWATYRHKTNAKKSTIHYNLAVPLDMITLHRIERSDDVVGDHLTLREKLTHMVQPSKARLEAAQNFLARLSIAKQISGSTDNSATEVQFCYAQITAERESD